MKRGFQPVGPRPGGERVLKKVTLPDGQEIEFEVLVIDKPDEDDPATGVRPKSPPGSFGQIPRRSGV